MSKRILGPGQPEPLPWPEAPAGWRWSRWGTPCQLQAPDGWQTKNYNYPERALAEAQRRILSQPKPKEAAVTTQPMTADQAARALRSAGYIVKAHGLNYILGGTSAQTQVLQPDELINYAHTITFIRGGAGEAPAGWTAACGQCGQQFIADAPIADGALCPSCSGAAARGDPAPIGALSNGAWLSLPTIKLFPMLEAHAKNLGTLTPETLIPVPRDLPDRLLVPIGCVVPGRYQPRSTFDESELAELADSIREHGILNPPLVFVNEKGDFELIAGERRLRAAHIVGLSMLPIEVRPYTLRQIAEISGVDNLQRAQLSALEKGRYFNRLIAELGLSENALAKRLGVARPTIQQCRAVAAAATELHAALDAGTLTFSQARAIALAAPGDHKAQKQALTLLAERARNGRAPNEAEARQETEKIVRKRLEADLKKLGWQFTSDGDVWAESERPRKWTGAEMLETVKQARRPSGTPPAGEVDQAQLAIARLRYDPAPIICGPWVGFATTWGGPYTYYAPDELPAMAAETQAQLDTYAARAQAHGWQFAASSNTSFSSFVFTGPKGGRETAYYWNDIEKKLSAIEAGAIGERAGQTASQSTSIPARVTQQKCGACGQPSTGTLRYIDGEYRCDTCVAPILAAREAAQAALCAKVDAAIGAWLRAAPEGALALFTAVCAGEPVEEAEKTEEIASRVILDIATYVSEWDIGPEETPTVAALLGLIEPAEAAAADLLGAEETPTVADFVRVAAAALSGDLAAADEAPAAAAPAGPLAEIEAAVDELEDWAENLISYADEELRVTQNEAAAIRTELEALADAPDVSDAAYEQLSARLGDIEQAIKQALNAQAVAA